MSIFNRPRLTAPALSDGTTPPTPRPPTHGRAWHELHDMCHKLGVDLDHEHIEALTVQDFMRLAYAGGFKACEGRLASPDVADGIAQALDNPGSIVERAWPDEPVARWSVRAVQKVVAYGVPK